MAKIKKGFLRAVYNVKGEKIRYLPEFLHRKNINVYEFVYKSEKECIVTIDFLDTYKFFAICKNMCYNKKIIKHKGVLSPITFIISKTGFIIGGILFVILSALFNNLLLDVKVTGSGSCFEEQTKQIVYEQGATKYSWFSKLDYKEIERQILTQNPRLSFVAVKKQGNILVVDTVLSSSEPSILGKNTSDLVAEFDGVIEDITVLRGTALVTKGQQVKAGDKLVGAYLLGKEGEEYKTFVLARVKILKNTEYFYRCDGKSEIDVSVAYALAEFNESGEIKEKRHEIVDGGIKVILTVRRTIYGG